MRQKQCLLPLVALLPRFLRLLWLLLDGWGKPAHEAALNLPSGGVRRLFDSGKTGSDSSVFTYASLTCQPSMPT